MSAVCMACPANDGRLGATRMPQYVRAWINEWDLVRLDPTCRPKIEVVPVAISYTEQVDLEVDDPLG